MSWRIPEDEIENRGWDELFLEFEERQLALERRKKKRQRSGEDDIASRSRQPRSGTND